LKYLAIPEIKNTSNVYLLCHFPGRSSLDDFTHRSKITDCTATATVKLVQSHQKKTSLYAASQADNSQDR
ncbi:hypothetical protein T4D_2854, partial [Trichinella pseudospiralis]